MRAAFGKSCVAESRRLSYVTRMKTILAPIDFSPASDAVITQAVSLARALDGRVVLLTVLQPLVVTAEYAPLLENIAEITIAGEKHAARQLAKLQERLRTDFVKVETVQLTGAPVPHIVEQAEKHGADYIVMGSHGHTAFYDLVVGSTTHGVVKRARCPVVIVPPQKTKPSKAKK